MHCNTIHKLSLYVQIISGSRELAYKFEIRFEAIFGRFSTKAFGVTSTEVVTVSIGTNTARLFGSLTTADQAPSIIPHSTFSWKRPKHSQNCCICAERNPRHLELDRNIMVSKFGWIKTWDVGWNCCFFGDDEFPGKWTMNEDVFSIRILENGNFHCYDCLVEGTAFPCEDPRCFLQTTSCDCHACRGRNATEEPVVVMHSVAQSHIKTNTF